jgi:hypothetical protein
MCVYRKGGALLPACATAAVVVARCRRLCADEDARQHGRCDESSGWRASHDRANQVAVETAASSCLRVVLAGTVVERRYRSRLLGTAVRQNPGPLSRSGRKLADLSAAPIKGSLSAVEDQEIVSVGGLQLHKRQRPHR